MQANVVHASCQLVERVNQGFHVFDRRHAHHRTDIDPTIVGLQRNIAKTFVLNAVGNNLAGVGGSTHTYLDKTGTTEQTSDTPCTLVDLFRKHVEETNPTRTESRKHPFGGNNLLFTFARINAMFRKQYRHMVDGTTQTSQQSAISGGNRMIDLRFRHFAAHQVQHRQQHGSRSMESVCIGHIRVFLHADLCEQVNEFTALQERQRMHAFGVEQVEQHIPVRAAKIHQFAQ